MVPGARGDSAVPPLDPVKLVFIHHSVGEAWLDDSQGGLGQELMDFNYFVSDTNYGWGPPDEDAGDGTIGDHTDIGHWFNWFVGPNRDMYMEALVAESGQNSSYTRLATDPGGENDIIMFKSCFPNSALGGSPGDEPSDSPNLLRGKSSGEEVHSVQNAKGIYNDLLEYYATRQDKLFVVVTAPPLIESETNSQQAVNARALNRWWNSGLLYYTENGGNFSAYAVNGDSHPTAAGLQKASGSLGGFLNAAHNSWKKND